MAATYDHALPEDDHAGEIQAGLLPAWKVRDLPAPPPYNLRNVLAVVGPDDGPVEPDHGPAHTLDSYGQLAVYVGA